MGKIINCCGVFILLIACFGCVEPIDTYSKVAPGPWRGVLYLTENQEFIGQEIDEFATQQNYSGELPFIFDVIYDNEEDFHIEIRNGSERIIVDNIFFGRDPQLAKDTLIVQFPVYDTELSVIVEDHLMEGFWTVNFRDNYRIKFKAKYGDTMRFTQFNDPSKFSMDGKWATIFSKDSEDDYPAIGDFKQVENLVTGTFLTETGDYRFLEGKVSGDKVYLSCFDGAHAYLFEAKMIGDSLVGQFFSGNHWLETWTASRDPNAKLKSAFELTKRIGNKPLSFDFKNYKGVSISLDDERYKDKIKLVKLMWTGCPNCRDQSKFLLDYLDNNPSDDIEIIGIAFERNKDEAKNIAAIKRYVDLMNIPYEVVLGGKYEKSEAAKVFPGLSDVLAYPTLLFLDKNNFVKRIHTGFAGPATKEHKGFKIEFEEIIRELRYGS